MAVSLSPKEIEYLRSQLIGRLATVDRKGAPQNNPMAFFYVPETGTIDFGGYQMPETRKYRNVLAGSAASFVVDDLVSPDPWQVRGIEVRGRAEVVEDAEPLMPGMARERIRLYPDRVISWGLD
jgi:pyridoxamine 5'-phosphate oxidase family protein